MLDCINRYFQWLEQLHLDGKRVGMIWLRLSKNLVFFPFTVLLYAGCEPETSNLPKNLPGDQQGLLPTVSAPVEKLAEPTKPQPLESGVTSWIDGVELPLEIWYSQYAGEKCVGFSYFSVKPSETQGSNLLLLVNSDVIEIRDALGGPQRKEVNLESLERPDGQLLSFTETTRTAGATTETSATLIGNTLTVTTTANNKPVATSINWPKGVWGPLGSLAMLRLYSQLSDGPRQAQVYVRQLNKIVKVDLNRGQPELTTLPGGIVKELTPFELVLTADEGVVKTKNWVGTSGEIVKSIGQYGFSMFQITSSEAELIDAEIRAAELLETTVPINSSIDVFNSPQVTYKIEATHRDPFALFPANVNQKVKSISARTSEVVVVALDGQTPVPQDQLQDAPDPSCTQSSTWITLEKDAVQTLAQELAGTSQETIELITKLTHGVHQKIKPEKQSRKLMRPAETATTLSGDCTAQATLLVALLRSKGVPARVASGLHMVAAGNQSQGVFHMWCEAWLGDRWLPLDPFLGTVGVKADHLKLLESSLDGENPYDAVLPVLQVMPQLTISI